MEAFDVKEEKVATHAVADYDIFKDKELLDNLRNTIISNLIDDKIPNNKLLHEYINDEIDKLRHSATASLFETKDVIATSIIDGGDDGWGDGDE